jgi:hypothetical protein
MHSVEKSLWKKLRTCHKTDYVMMVVMVVVMMMIMTTTLMV